MTSPLVHPLSPRGFAAPSWVLPGTFAQNCAFLAGRVDEVGLLFFEAKKSLSYKVGDEETLSLSLAGLPLRYHAHLPSDLPWQDGQKAAEICHGIISNIAYLSPRAGVLHPPPDGADAAKALRDFMTAWQALGHAPDFLMLENIDDNDLRNLRSIIEEYDLPICLDMGHVLKYDQQALIDDAALLDRVKMTHMNAPGKGGEHLPLTRLEARYLPATKRLLRAVPPTAVIMMEIFDWSDIEDSLPIMRRWLQENA